MAINIQFAVWGRSFSQFNAVKCSILCSCFKIVLILSDSMWQYTVAIMSSGYDDNSISAYMFIQFWTQAITAVYDRTTLQIDSVAAGNVR